MLEHKKGLEKPIFSRSIEMLFHAYFNNKMMILLMMIEHPMIARDVLSIERQKLFLHDLYHHFLPSHMPVKYHHAFRWLGLFFEKFPDVGPSKIARATEMVALIYEAFDMKLEPRLVATRIAREKLGPNGHRSKDKS